MNDYVEFGGWSLLFAVCWLLDDFRSGSWEGEKDVRVYTCGRTLDTGVGVLLMWDADLNVKAKAKDIKERRVP